MRVLAFFIVEDFVKNSTTYTTEVLDGRVLGEIYLGPNRPPLKPPTNGLPTNGLPIMTGLPTNGRLAMIGPNPKLGLMT